MKDWVSTRGPRAPHRGLQGMMKPDEQEGGAGLGSVAGACNSRATMSESVATWLTREVRVEVVETEEVFNSPISPVTWENVEESSAFSLVSWSEWLHTTVSSVGMLGLSIPVPVACLGLPRSVKGRNVLLCPSGVRLDRWADPSKQNEHEEK